MIPNYKDKLKYPSLISPKKHLEYLKSIGKFPNKAPPKLMLLCYQSSFIKRIKEKYLYEVGDGCFHKLIYLNNNVALADFGVGAPQVCAKVELLSAWGVKKFISIGIAGTLQANVSIGSLVICEKAVRDEGTSYHYETAEEFAYPNPEMLKKLIEVLKHENIKYILGPSWTLDSFYRQTKEEIKHYQEKGILTDEMEASALFTVANYCKVNIAAAFVISDILSDLEWDAHFFKEERFEKLDCLLECCLKIL